MDMLRHAQFGAGVPARPVQDEHDLFACACSHGSGKCRQLHLKERDGDSRGEMEDRATGTGMDKADEVAPRVAVLHRRERPLAVETPDLVQDRLEANAVFVDRPEFDLR
jgi:hypothetical protein